MAHEDEYAAGVMSGGNMRKLGMHRKTAAKSKALKKAGEGKKTYGNGRSDKQNRESDQRAIRQEIHEKYSPR